MKELKYKPTVKYDTLADFFDAVADSVEQEDHLGSTRIIRYESWDDARGCVCALGAHAYRTIPQFKAIVDDVRAGKGPADDKVLDTQPFYDTLEAMLPGVREVPRSLHDGMKHWDAIGSRNSNHIETVYEINDRAPDRRGAITDKAYVVQKLRDLAAKARIDRVPGEAVAV